MRNGSHRPRDPRDEGWLPDADLKYIILGALRMVPQLEAFPVLVREVIDNFDENGVIKDFTIVTFSGLRFTVSVRYDGDGDG
jgi:hypothetical protein